MGYSIDSRMTSHLAVDALEMAIARRGRDQVPGCVVHADRGSQFRSRPYVAALHRHGLRGSMGRVASSADNAAMESFFSLLQKNVLNARRWDTRAGTLYDALPVDQAALDRIGAVRARSGALLGGSV